MQSQKNRLFIAAAGAGKTTFIVKEAAENEDKRILITTFTEQNEVEIHNKFRKLWLCPTTVLTPDRGVL